MNQCAHSRTVCECGYVKFSGTLPEEVGDSLQWAASRMKHMEEKIQRLQDKLWGLELIERLFPEFSNCCSPEEITSLPDRLKRMADDAAERGRAERDHNNWSVRRVWQNDGWFVDEYKGGSFEAGKMYGTEVVLFPTLGDAVLWAQNQSNVVRKFDIAGGYTVCERKDGTYSAFRNGDLDGESVFPGFVEAVQWVANRKESAEDKSDYLEGAYRAVWSGEAWIVSAIGRDAERFDTREEAISWIKKQITEDEDRGEENIITVAPTEEAWAKNGYIVTRSGDGWTAGGNGFGPLTFVSKDKAIEWVESMIDSPPTVP